MHWTNRSGVAARLLPAVHALELTIEGLATKQLRLPGDGFERITTVVELRGGGCVGRGEDVAYSSDLQARLPEAYDALVDGLRGTWTMATLAEHLDAHPLERPTDLPPSDDKPGFHRWALESAALDLALRQAQTNLATLVGEAWEPVRVSLSMGLGDPPTTETLEGWLARDRSTTFKIDSAQSWTPELVQQLAELHGAVTAVDFKGLYHGPWIDNTPRPELYAAVAALLPQAVIEDANLTDEVREAFDEDSYARLAWDYPITAPQDVPGLPGSTAEFSDLRPGAINIKPSRFGSFARLLSTIDVCDREGIPCYSGGQYELGIGRTQVQSIASLCFPEGPNDCAPAMFHGATPALEDAPLGPVTPPSRQTGFGWDAPSPALDA